MPTLRQKKKKTKKTKLTLRQQLTLHKEAVKKECIKIINQRLKEYYNHQNEITLHYEPRHLADIFMETVTTTENLDTK